MSIFINEDVVPADLVINETLAKNEIETQCGLSISSIRLMGEGFDNAVFLVNDHVVFRFPRRKRAIELLEREIVVLPLIQNSLDLKVPLPVYFGKPSKHYPSPFYGHELIKGFSGCSLNLTLIEYRRAASLLGLFLRKLHAWKMPKEVLLTPAFDRADFPKLLGLFNTRWPVVKNQFSLGHLDAKIRQICENASQNAPRLSGTTFVHGDLYHRHLLFDAHHDLYGVIDWGDCCLSHIAVDLGILYQYFPLEVHEDFLRSYGDVDSETLAYARFVGLYYSVTLLWFGHARNDRDLVRSSLNSLSGCYPTRRPQ